MRASSTRRAALPGEALHPDAVADQDVIQRGVQRAEEGAAIGAIIGIGQLRRGIVEPPVDPFVVGRQHGDLWLHDALPGRRRTLA